jgi:hypothetical protein
MRHTHFRLPNASMRRELFAHHLPNPERVTADYEVLAELSRGLSGGDILNISKRSLISDLPFVLHRHVSRHQGLCKRLLNRVRMTSLRRALACVFFIQLWVVFAVFFALCFKVFFALCFFPRSPFSVYGYNHGPDQCPG